LHLLVLIQTPSPMPLSSPPSNAASRPKYVVSLIRSTNSAASAWSATTDEYRIARHQWELITVKMHQVLAHAPHIARVIAEGVDELFDDAVVRSVLDADHLRPPQPERMS